MPKYIVKVDLDKNKVLSCNRYRGYDPEHAINAFTYLIEANCKKKIAKKVNMFMNIEKESMTIGRRTETKKQADVMLDSENNNLSIAI